MTDHKDPFDSCQRCVVKDWCRLRSGEAKLPPLYHLTSFCSAFDMLEKAIKLANISPEYREANRNNYSYEGIDEDTAYVIRRMLDNPVSVVENGANVLVIHPNKGTGKTYLANAVMNEFIYKVCRDPNWFDYEKPVALYQKFGVWANIQRNVAALNDPANTLKAHKLNQHMMEVPLLIVDDIGTGRITPFVRDLFYDIVDYRKEQQLATIYTSNFPEEKLEQDDMLGDTIMSRMVKNSVYISLGGRDRRRD